VCDSTSLSSDCKNVGPPAASPAWAVSVASRRGRGAGTLSTREAREDSAADESVGSGSLTRNRGLLRFRSSSGWSFVGDEVLDLRLRLPLVFCSSSSMMRALSKAFQARSSSCDSGSGLLFWPAARLSLPAPAISRNRFAAPGPAARAATWKRLCHSRNSLRSLLRPRLRVREVVDRKSSSEPYGKSRSKCALVATDCQSRAQAARGSARVRTFWRRGPR
jgi:hypothetical protein